MIHNNLAEGETKREMFEKLVAILGYRTDKSTSFDCGHEIFNLYHISPSIAYRLMHSRLRYNKGDSA